MSIPVLSLRPFTVADAPVVGAWLDGPGVSLPPSGMAAKWAARLVGDPRVRAWVLLADARPAAFVRLDIGPDRVAELTIAVAVGHRRRGLGAAALEMVLAQAKALRVRRVQAIVDAANQAAQAFFTKAGFEEGSADSGSTTFLRWIHEADVRVLELES
jgi:RimJ/RimL family protein N-acetyltransferase